MGDIILDIKNIRKCFSNKKREVEVLRDVTFQLRKGVFYSIEGESGCGKSTLLSIISGIRRPDEGSIIYYKDGREIELTAMDDEYLSQIRRHDIAYISQFQDIIPGLTVEENIKLVDVFDSAGMKGKKGKNGDDFELLLSELGLMELKNEYPEYLSGGELRRLIIARTVYAKPGVILADEPTNDLDKANRTIILKMLKSLTEKGITVIAVTHEKEVREYADEYLELKGGVIGKSYY